MKTALYFHGFLSSPASAKVRILREALMRNAPEVKLIAPDMNHPPRCMDQLLGEIAERIDLANTTVIGSSLGGFFASRFSNRYQTRCILLNPCLDPWSFIGNFLGEQKIYGSDRTIVVEPEFEGDFHTLYETTPAVVNPNRDTLTLISTADEVLPWEKTYRMTEGSRRVLLEGEDHQISGFEKWADLCVDFILHGFQSAE